METTEQAIDRSTYLGGSDIGAILGVNKYRTALDVYEDKLGLRPKFEGNQHTERGTRLEAIAAAEYCEQARCAVIRRSAPLVHPVFPFLGGHIDRKIVGQPAIIEIKCPSLGAFSKIKREGLGEDYTAQMQWYLGLGGFEYGEWVIFCADQWELVTFRVEAEPELFRDMVARGVEFWQNHVVAKVPPVVEPDAPALAFAKIEGTVPVTERTDAEFIAAMELLAEAKRLSEEAELIEADAKARVKELIAETPGIYVSPGARLSFTMASGRASFDKAALAKAKPVDREKVALVFDQYGVSPVATMKALDECTLDLAQFEKRGAPYAVLKPTFYGRG